MDAVFRALADRIRCFVGVSHAVAGALRGIGIPAAKIAVIHNGLDIRRFQQNGTPDDALVRLNLETVRGRPIVTIVANFEHRVNKKEAQSRNYQSRPMTQLTDQRFVSTGGISAKGDDIVGLEFAAIMKSFHVAAEAQKVWVKAARA